MSRARTTTASTPPDGSVAAQLLDAQVAYHLRRLSEDQVEATLAPLFERFLVAGDGAHLDGLVNREAIAAVLSRLLVTVPGSAAVGSILDLLTDVAYTGPAEPFPLGDLIDRDDAVELVDAGFAFSPVVERALDRLSDSPLVGAMASRFMGRIVNEVIQVNRAMADKVPGLGTLMGLGTSAASLMKGAADKQFESLVGQGGAFATRGLNRIVAEMLRDPTTREAVLQIWDLLAQEPVAGLRQYAGRDDFGRLVESVHGLVVRSLAHERAAPLAGALVEAFFEHFGGYTPAELLVSLEIQPEDLLGDLQRLAPQAMAALRETGDLESLIRSQLAPFYASEAVTSLLG